MNSRNIIIAILACLLAAVILFTCNCRKVAAPVTISTKEQVQVVVKKEAEINPIIDSLKFVNVQLQSQIIDQSIDLAIAQANNKIIAGKIRVVHDTTTVKDNEYYTQQQVINDLINNNAIADSLCNVNIENLSGQIDNYKKVINLKDSLNFQIRQSFNTAIKQQDILQGYSKKLERKVKWTQAGKWAWKGAALVGGLFILKTAIK